MKQFVTLAILVLTLITGVQARAWGVSVLMEWQENRGALLSMKVLKNHKIDYCVELAPDFKTVPNSINQQIEAGLTMWINPVIKIINHTVDIDSVPCGDPRMDLKVAVGHFPEVNTNGRTSYLSTPSGPAETIILNLDPPLKGTTNNRIIKLTDFAFYLPPKVDLEKILDFLINGPTMHINSYAQKFMANNHGLDVEDLNNSTFIVLLHELGHSMGLCHTYNLRDCSKVDRLDVPAEQQPDSVMKENDFLNLTNDDLTGIKRVFELANGYLSK